MFHVQSEDKLENEDPDIEKCIMVTTKLKPHDERRVSNLDIALHIQMQTWSKNYKKIMRHFSHE